MPKPVRARLSAGIHGRKWQQIRALYNALENPQRPVTEWCGGKGYLGRLLASQWQQPVMTLEYQPELVASGTALAKKFGVNQLSKRVDVVNDPVAAFLHHRHTIALHACGDLHRLLVEQLIATRAPGFAIVPCCYHLGQAEAYTPFTAGLQLRLSRESLRLAVNETVTAQRYEVEQHRRDMAWKLGALQLRAFITGDDGYQPFLPVARAWLKDDFSSFCRKLFAREGWPLSDDVDWLHWQGEGERRAREVARLQLVRHAFRRVLELWLVMDMAVHLEQHGYRVSVSTFCERVLTPRNILIEGKL